MYSKSRLTKIQDKNESKLEKMEYDSKLKEWDELGLPNPFEVVEDFIKEKGLKLYGGKALDLHLRKRKSPIYGRHEFPDYDVYSPNAWVHAKEIARILHKKGFSFVEARASILNDYDHSTFKVGIDALYVLDITQMGCTPRELRNKNCDSCGRTKDGKCLSLFNEVPANAVTYTGKNPRVYRETYNFRTDKGLYPDKFLICDVDYLKSSMFREMTEPYHNPKRLVKVGTRLQKMQNLFETKLQTCSKEQYKKMVNKHLRPVLEEIAKFIKSRKLINYGASAHNLFVKNKKGVSSLGVSDYKVFYSENTIPVKRRTQLAKKYKHITNGVANLGTDLKVELLKKFPHMKFEIHHRQDLWKQHETNSIVFAVHIDGKVNNLVTFTKQDGCLPYLVYNGVRYVTIEKIKYLYYQALSIPHFIKLVDNDPLNYRCLLTDIMKAEKMTKKRNRLSYRGKFRKNVTRCSGDQFSKIQENLSKRFMAHMERLKHTKIKINKPRRGYVTRISKMPKGPTFIPFKPEEEELKRK